MPSKTAKSAGGRASNVSSASDVSNEDYTSPQARTDRSPNAAKRSLPLKKKPRPQKSPPPSPLPDDSSSDSDAYAAEIIASSSSIDDDSDVFDPTKSSDTESEFAQRRRSNASRVTTTSSAIESPLESELDEEDLDIGLNYHAKSVPPKKRPSSSSPMKSPTIKRNTGTPSKKSGKRKRDEYLDVARSDPEEDGDSEIVEIEVPSKSMRLEKKAIKSASVSPAKGMIPPKKPVKRKKDNSGDSDEGRFTVVGKIVQAPATGRVPPGRISQNTLDFLSKLADPACNDREWFKLNEPVYRLAEKEWKAFMEVLIPMTCEVDEQLPPLPTNDVIHRIYRDIRFSNDKTPYKRNFSASMTRTGRKGKFAGYHMWVERTFTLSHTYPSESFKIRYIWSDLYGLEVLYWRQGYGRLKEMRSFRSANILHDPTPLRGAISEPTFIKLFGEPKPHPKGLRRNVFGEQDQLKVAPKGIAKDHPDIDLLKLRTVAVVQYFTDKEILKPDFNKEVVRIMTIMRPLVHVLNDMITLPPGEGESD